MDNNSSLVNSEESVNKFIKEVEQNRSSYLNDIYEKNVICPVCGETIKVKTVKSKSARLTGKDSDLMNHYAGVNPLLYGVSFCNECGYAALSNSFNDIKEREKELIKRNISSKWKPKDFGQEYFLEDAIQLHKLALLNATIKQVKSSELALICLKLSWLFRLNQNFDSEKLYQKYAVDSLEKAYQMETAPFAGMDEGTTVYLIGELNRRLENNEIALRYFSLVLSSNSYSSKIKDMTRDQKDLITKNKQNTLVS